MRRGNTLLAVAVTALVLLTGCASTDAAPDTDATIDASDSAADVEGVSVPLAPGADTVARFVSESATIVRYVVPLDAQESTIAFYDDWTAGQPDDYSPIEVDSGGVSWQNDPEPDGEKHLITLLSRLEGDDFISVSITVGPPE